jgi:hypothetical protein
MDIWFASADSTWNVAGQRGTLQCIMRSATCCVFGIVWRDVLIDTTVGSSARWLFLGVVSLGIFGILADSKAAEMFRVTGGIVCGEKNPEGEDLNLYRFPSGEHL